MILGTMSNAGKSTLAAGLCRILTQDGFKVAPFKSQNMALNSFVTVDGLEMSRAQAVQAECCRCEPSVCMNPILLKPSGNAQSQVIVLGEVFGEYRAANYYHMKKMLREKVVAAYKRLQKENDIVVIEGAGSPVELNLNKDDFVNMGMAKIADAPCLLVGDINLGGIFAQMYGTMQLLSRKERKRIKGMIINKFRGDIKLFESGVKIMQKKCGTDVLGVLPYMDRELDAEDSLTARFQKHRSASLINIAVIHLPHIAHFTDFAILEATKNISVNYVTDTDMFETYDIVIIPGTQNPMSDAAWLRKNAFDTKIAEHVHAGKLLFGIGGGCGILGKKIAGSALGENTSGEAEGLHLLPIETKCASVETRCRFSGTGTALAENIFAGAAVDGYEIQSGKISLHGNAAPLIHDTQGKAEGCFLHPVYACSVHGFFDSEEVRRRLFDFVARQKNINPAQFELLSPRAEREKTYEALAQTMREHLDMQKIKKIIGV